MGWYIMKTWVWLSIILNHPSMPIFSYVFLGGCAACNTPRPCILYKKLLLCSGIIFKPQANDIYLVATKLTQTVFPRQNLLMVSHWTLTQWWNYFRHWHWPNRSSIDLNFSLIYIHIYIYIFIYNINFPFRKAPGQVTNWRASWHFEKKLR